MTRPSDHRLSHCEPNLLLGAGVTAILGAAALVIGTIAGGVVVPNHDWVAETISDLAAGPWEIIVDVSLYGFAVALGACAIGAAHFHPGGRRWNLGVLGLCLLAMIVVIIAARDEYGDGDTTGVVVHYRLVYALGAIFAALFWLMADGMGRSGPGWRRLSLVCAVLWSVGAPIFFMLPTDVDGAFERALGLVSATWVAGFGALLIVGARRVR